MQGHPGQPYYAPRPSGPPQPSGPNGGLPPTNYGPPPPGIPPPAGVPGAVRPSYGGPPPPQPPVSQFQQMKVGGGPPPGPGSVRPGPPPGPPPPPPAISSGPPRPGLPGMANGNGAPSYPQNIHGPPGPAPPAVPPSLGQVPRQAPPSGSQALYSAPQQPPQQQSFPRPLSGGTPGIPQPMPRPGTQPGAPRMPMQAPTMQPGGGGHPLGVGPPPSLQPPRPPQPRPPGNFPISSQPGLSGPPSGPFMGPPGAAPAPTPAAQPQPRTRLAGSAPTSPSNAGVSLQFAGGGGGFSGPPGAAPGPPHSFSQGAARQQFPGAPPAVGSFGRPMPGGPSGAGAPPPTPGGFSGGPTHPMGNMQQMYQAGAGGGGIPSGGYQQPPSMPRPGGGFPPPPTGFGGPPQPQAHQYPQQQHQHQPATPLSPGSAGGGGWGAPPSFGAPPLGPGTTPQQGAAAPAAQGMGGRNIDRGSMPRPPSHPPPTQVFETRRENTHTIPPPYDAPIVVRDYGTAGPRYMRASLNSVPQGADILKASSLPFVVIINPLAPPENGDSPLEVVDHGPAGPLRCSGCKAYVCPYMRWAEGGRKMECCFCGASTTVPPEYFSHISGDGTRRDKDERPELCRGSVEFEVAGEYLVRPPVPPTFFFLIEVTVGALSSGATATVCASVAQLLDELPGGERARVGIATFDSSVHFYAPKTSADEGASQPAMLVMSDVMEPFSPLGGSAATVSLAEHKPALKALLESIPKTFSQTQVVSSAGGAALKAAVEGLKSGVGGRLVAFITSLPQCGALALRPREAGKPPSDRDVLDVMVPEGKAYAALAQDAAAYQVSIDVFVLSQGYVDLASLSTLSSETSGSVYRYNPFAPVADGPRFHNDLRWCLIRPQAYEAVARLRVSSGLAVDNYVGAFHRRNPTDLHFSALSCDHAVAAKLIHEERLREGSEVYLQYALLYTSTEGSRRVRVHTMALPVTRSLGSVFRGSDLDSYATYVTRKVSAQLPGKTIAACREVVIKAAVDTLVAYRRHVANASSSAQLILPESLRLLPLFFLGLIKLPCFRTDARADSRAVWMYRLLTEPSELILPALNPRLFALHTLPSRPPNAPRIPDKIWLTAEQLDPEGIFLLENGFDAHLFVGGAVPPETCMALLGVPTSEHVDLTQFSGPPELDTPLNKAVRSLLDEVRRQRRSYMHLRLMRRGHPQEAAFLASLVEDRSPSAGMSYVEMLCLLHRQIQNKME